MAVEIPSSLIRQIQDALRKEAGVPEFDPADPALPGLPSFEEAISGLDPSAPPYLRCKECRGPLLRGLLSTACVFCGTEQRRDPPLSISFSATLGCRKLLQSLDLDGSEVVELNTESKDSGKGQGTEKAGLVLSNLLDIELIWPSKEEKVQTSSTSNVPAQSTLNLSGVDLDNFFSETKKEVGSDAHHVSDEILVPHKETDSEDFGLFEELRPIDKAVTYVETKPSDIGDSSGAWEAEFQSAPSHISSTDPSSKDFFQDSLSINYASATVGEQLNVESEVNREGKNTALSSNSSQVPYDDWPLDVLWHTTDSVVPSAAKQFNGKSNTDGGELKPNSMAHDWVQPDIWPTSSASIPSTNENIQTNDDSFDDWQDFTSSGNAPDALSNSWTQASTVVTLSNERESGISQMSFTDRLEDVDFGSFGRSDMLPGLSDLRTDSCKLETVQSEASVSGRMNEWEITAMNGEIWPMADKNEVLSSTQSSGTANADVQDLLSQMPDLSFMLENHLSIPKKVEPSD